MRRVLITGSDSYIGVSLENWLAKEPYNYQIATIDVRNTSWKEQEFSGYDVVFHIAGIVHVKENKENRDLYYKVNRDLAYEVAKKAKAEKVKQFIFLSSMSVYGVEKGVIGKSTPLKPKSNYGKSKLQAEELILSLRDDSFKVAILRPPLIYGKGCKGNYPRLSKLAVKIPIFPDVDNIRSMIYIDNLLAYITLLIDGGSGGLYFPQNDEYVNTSNMVKLIAKVHGKKLIMTKVFNPLLRLLKTSTVSKVFGDLVYDKSLSENEKIGNIAFVSFEDSIKFTEL